MKKITLDKAEKVLRVLLITSADDEVRRALFTAIQVVNKESIAQKEHAEYLQHVKAARDWRKKSERMTEEFDNEYFN